MRITDKTIEIFYNHNRIASHRRLDGRKGQYSTVTEHMPASHQQYLEWNGDRFRKWAERIGSSTYQVVDAILTSKRVEQQSYRSCMGLLKLADKYSVDRLEADCRKALSFTMLSIVFRKFIPKLNRLDCYVPGWAMPVKDARTTPVLDGQWADW